MKYYHIYADRKTVREISQQEYNKLSQRLGYVICWVDTEGVLFVKGRSVIYIPLAQLKQILEDNE